MSDEISIVSDEEYERLEREKVRPSMKVDEAWDAFEEYDACCSRPEACVCFTPRRDAARVLALAVHVEACGKRAPVTDADGMRGLRDCGDGWLCDVAPSRFRS